MHASELNLKEALQFSPERGMITLGSQRVVLLSVETIGSLVEEIINIGDVHAARVILRRCGEIAGRSLARLFKEEFTPANEQEWLAFGPAMHAWEGVAHPELLKLEYDQAAGTFFLHVRMLNSYLAEQYVQRLGTAGEPVCWMLAGHITGYCSEVFGMELLCKETLCVAKGDPHCEFIVQQRAAWM